MRHSSLFVHRAPRGLRHAPYAVRPPYKSTFAAKPDTFCRVFRRVTPTHPDRYLDDLRDAKISLGLKYRRVGEVRRLWAHREILPPFMQPPSAPPWNGEDPRDLFEKVRSQMENRTPRIDERVMQTLLVWALRFVEDFAADIISAHVKHTRLHALSPELIRRPAGRQKRGGYLPGQLRRAVIDYLDKLHAHGGHLPGHLSSDGKLQIDWRHIERLFVCSAEIRRNGTGRLIIESGLPLDPDIPLDTSVTGLLDGSPWRTTTRHPDWPGC